MGSPHPGHGKLVDPSSVRGIPDVLQVVALSLIMAPRMFRPRLTPLYASSASCWRLHESQSAMLTRADHQRPVTCPTPTAFDTDGLTWTNSMDVITPQEQTNNARAVPCASGSHQTRVLSTNDVSRRVPTKHDQVKIHHRAVRFEVCNGHLWWHHGPQTSPLPISMSPLSTAAVHLEARGGGFYVNGFTVEPFAQRCLIALGNGRFWRTPWSVIATHQVHFRG